MSDYKNTRLSKFVDNYVVFDLETTSLHIQYAEVIEISALRVKNGHIIDQYSTLVKPSAHIPQSATAVNGITDEMVKDSPVPDEAIKRLIDFIGTDPLVGHNISGFDIRVLNEFCNRTWGFTLDNPYIDTLYLSRICLPNLKSHKLSSLCDYLGIQSDGAHRAYADCVMTHQLYLVLRQYCEENSIQLEQKGDIQKRKYQQHFTDETLALQSLEEILRNITADNVLTIDEFKQLEAWTKDNIYLAGNYPFDLIIKAISDVLEDGVIEQHELDSLLHLFKQFNDPVESATHGTISTLEGMHCCITGDFDYGSRTKVEQFIVEHGGICDSNVKKATNYVIVGAKGSDAWKNGNYGGKIKKAIEYNNKGLHIELISEHDFFKEIQ